MKNIGYKMRLFLGLIGVVLILAIFSWRMLESARISDQDAEWVAETYDVIFLVEQIMTAMADIETGQRGFVITSDENYLAPFESGVNRVDSLLARLRRLTAKHELQRSHLDSLQSIVRQKMAWSGEIIRTGQARGREAAVEMVRQGTGKRTMDQLRHYVDVMRSEAARLLRERREMARASGAAENLMSAVSIGVMFLLTALLYFSGHRYPSLLERMNRELEEKVKHQITSITALNRLYATLSQVNQLIVRTRSREEIFHSICEVAVQHGNFRLAWIGLYDPGTHEVRPMGSAGQDGNTLPFPIVNAFSVPFREGLIGSAVSSGTIAISNDIESDSRMAHWREHGRRGGYRSAVAVPFREHGKIAGVLNFYAAESDFFSRPQEQKLLEEMSLDISFALEMIELEREKNRVLEKLRRNETLLNTAGHLSRVGGWELDPISMELTWTDETYEIHGLSRDYKPDVENAINFYSPEARPIIREAVERAMKEGEGWDLELPFITATGERIWVRAFGRSELQQGKCVRVYGAFQDVTGRKMADEALRKSEEQFRLISENVADMIAVLDLEGRRLYINPAYQPLLGDLESFRNTDSFQEIHPEDREKMVGIFRETVRTGIGQRAEYRFLSPTGEIRAIESQGSVIRNKEGDVVRVVVVSRDVTEKKMVEKQFLRMQRMESIGTLAGGIAHDLNNVLAPILLSLDIIRRQSLDEKAQNILAMVQTTAQRGADLIRQVLSFARGIEGERSLVQIRHIVEEIGKVMTETLPKTITIRTSAPKSLPAVHADATQLHQVLMNLCVNARDAMPKGGVLEIRAESVTLDEQYARMHVGSRPGSYVVLTISDQGMGIPPTVMERIFEPFFTTKEIGKGTGLGLSTVQAIIKSHEGFINVYSELGKGTTFKVYLPAESVTEVERTEREEKPPHGNGECILVIDDEFSIREITKVTLEAYGYTVKTAADGTEAIALYASNPAGISLVITDMMMPFLDGVATIRALSKLNPGVRVLAMSGLKQHEEFLRESGVRFLQKPFTAETLLRAVAELQVIGGSTG